MDDIYKIDLQNYTTNTFKIYIYEDVKCLKYKDIKIKSNYADYFEYHFWKNIQYYQTHDANNAHIFLIPIFFSDHRFRDNSHDYLINSMEYIYNNFPYWKKSIDNNNINHIWISDSVDIKIPEYLRKNSILLTIDSDLSNINYNMNTDIAIPPCIKYSFSDKLYEKIRSISRRNERTINVFLMAQFGDSCMNRQNIMKKILCDDRINIKNNWIIKNKKVTTKIVDLYYEYLKQSKYGIFTRGDCVWSPRIIELIMYGCVPIIINDMYDLPFSNFLRWEKFCVIIQENEVHKLYDIVANISDDKLLEKQKYLENIAHHFVYNEIPEKHDAFDLIICNLLKT